MFTRLEGFGETPAWSCLLLDWPSLCLCCHRLVVTKPRGSGDKNDLMLLKWAHTTDNRINLPAKRDEAISFESLCFKRTAHTVYFSKLIDQNGCHTKNIIPKLDNLTWTDPGQSQIVKQLSKPIKTVNNAFTQLLVKTLSTSSLTRFEYRLVYILSTEHPSCKFF